MVMLVDLYNYRATAEFQNYINRTERRKRLSKIPNRKNHMEHRLTLFSSPCIKFRAFRQLRPVHAVPTLLRPARRKSKK